MRLLTLCMGLALAVVCCTSPAQAMLTISKTNSAGETFSGSTNDANPTSGVKTVQFTAADFNNHPTADIISIEVAISFTKLQGMGNEAIYPYYNEIQLIFGKQGGPSTTLVAPGPVQTFGDNSFGPGIGNGPGSGFDGVLTFSSTATTPVNRVPNQQGFPTQQVIPNTPGTAYRPASTEAASVPWDALVGQSAIGTFELNVGDVDFGAGDISFDPLVFRSMTVTITAVPEPSSLAAVGLLALGGTFIRRRRS